MVPNPKREKVASEKALLFQKNKTSNKNNKYIQRFVSITKESRSWGKRRGKRRRKRKKKKRRKRRRRKIRKKKKRML